MKFTISCGELKHCLQHIISVIPSKTTLPSLNQILLQAKNGVLTITATDLEISIKTVIPTTIETEGSITITGRLLYDFVREIPDTPIQFSVEGKSIYIQYPRGKYTFFGQDPLEYPQLPEIDKKQSISINKQSLLRHIEKVIFAVALEELRPALTGVLFQIRQNQYRLISTDGHRLVRVINNKFSSSEDVPDIIIPIKALTLLPKICGDGDEDIKMSFAQRYVLFESQNAALSVTLIEGKFPDYERVIPANEHKQLIINREQFSSSLRAASVVAHHINQQVKLSLQPDKITIFAQDMDLGEGIETVEAEYTGDPLEIGFSAVYLLAVLNHIDTEHVRLRFDTPVSATLVFPMTQNEGEDILMLIMPIKLAG
jgi:DNA polymerase-3 subunit beta